MRAAHVLAWWWGWTIAAIGFADGAKIIQDNSFLMEEAYNQEPGVIQHINFFRYSKDKSWLHTFTEEWPVPNQKNQLSLTLPFQSTGTDTSIGDVLLNYRYQVYMEGPVAFAPRLSAIFPTGSVQKASGNGALGVQTNLPLSVDLGSSFTTHWNIGATLIPSAKGLGGPVKENLLSFNYGVSLVWHVSSVFDPLVEVVGTSDETTDGIGGKARNSTFVVSPGLRYAFNFSGAQLVAGAAVPIGIGPSSGGGSSYGGIGYLSLEHGVW